MDRAQSELEIPRIYPWGSVNVSSNGTSTDLTVSNTVAGSYSLKVMTVVLALFFPAVLVYQSWTYYVFRRRIGQRPVGNGAEQVRCRAGS